MTDEEMAGERAEKYGIDLCCYCRECDKGKTKPCQHKIDAMHGYKDGFLAGLKAGRPQWHKVTDWKDNSQFPNEELKTYLVRLYQDHYVICEVEIIDGYYSEFYLPDNLEFIDPQDVIAWCEIPTFEKE